MTDEEFRDLLDMGRMKTVTYAGITQAEIVENLAGVMDFIAQLNIPNVDKLKQGVEQMSGPTGYLGRIASAKTCEELETAINTYKEEEKDFGFLARALPEVLQTYAALTELNDDYRYNQAFQLLAGYLSWGGMPRAGFHVNSIYDQEASGVMDAKIEQIKKRNGCFTVMPYHMPQLEWQFYVHPKKGVTRDELAAGIDATIKDLKMDKTTGLSSEFNGYSGHQRQGLISVVSGSKRAMDRLEQALVQKGLVVNDTFELIKSPDTLPKVREQNGFSRNWIMNWSMRTQ